MRLHSTPALAAGASADTPPIFDQQQVEFRACMGCPKTGFVWLHSLDGFLEHIALPRGSVAGMQGKFLFGTNSEQIVEQARISKIDFGGLDLPLV
jgi:hypothetical protein